MGIRVRTVECPRKSLLEAIIYGNVNTTLSPKLSLFKLETRRVQFKHTTSGSTISFDSQSSMFSVLVKDLRRAETRVQRR